MSIAGYSTASASGISIKTLVLASDYDFLPEGERVFRKAFDQIMLQEGIYAKIDYKRSSQFFEITCTDQDFQEVLTIAHSLYTELIQTERGDVYDELKSDLITKPSSQDELDLRIEGREGGSTNREELISFGVKSIWHCHTQDSSMSDLIPAFVQMEIERLTCTQLVEDLNGQFIHVYGQRQEQCDRAIYKLDIIRKYHALAKRHCHNIFFTEENDHYEISIRNLIEIKNKLVETTLLDPVYTSYEYAELAKACTVRCCPYLHVRCRFILKKGELLTPAVQEKDKRKVFDLWSGYHFPGIGDKSLKDRRARVSRPMPLEPLEIDKTVRKWLTSGVSDDPNELMEQMVADMQQAEKLGISPPASPDSSVLNCMNPDNSAQDDEQSAILSHTREPLSPPNDNSSALRPTTYSKNYLGIPSNRRPIHRVSDVQDLHFGTASRSENIRNPNVSQSLLDIDIDENEKRELGGIAIVTPSALMPSLVSDNGANSHKMVRFMEPHQPQPLLGSPTSDSNKHGSKSEISGEAFWLGSDGASDIFLPIIRDVSEVKTELVAFADLDIHKSSKNFCDDIEANAHIILASCRNYTGEVEMKCHFGRILIKPFNQSIMNTLEKAYSLPAEKICDLFMRVPEKVNFTKVITTLSADVRFLLGMRISETNRKIWSEATEWTVTYEYICCDHEDHHEDCAPQFIVEMDADSLETTVKSAPINFGDLNVHCTLRNWDYLIRFTGSRNLEEDYGDVAAAIKESTFIAAGSKEISMSFELSHRHQIHFLSIRVRRYSQHKSYDGKTLLNVTEVQDLHIDWDSGEDATTFFVAPSKEPNSTWYEIDLESVEAKVAFADNLNLETGEEAEWDPELLLHSGVLVNDICMPANYIITKMDGVGFYNDNGTNPLSTRMKSAASMKPVNEQRLEYHYW